VQGPEGPPGPGFGADLVHVAKLQWEPREPVTIPDAIALLRELTIFFSGQVDPASANRFAEFMLWVRLQTPQVSSPFTAQNVPPLFSLRGKASISPSSFNWALTDSPSSVQQAMVNGALVVIDLCCDYLLDEKGRPVSGGAGAFMNTDTFAPGGIFRTWIEVLAG
jgi:hypothetical protein